MYLPLFFRKKIREFKDRGGGLLFLLVIMMVCSWISPVFLLAKFLKRVLKKRK